MYNRSTYYYHILTSAEGVEKWLQGRGILDRKDGGSKEDQDQQQQQQQQQRLGGGQSRVTAEQPTTEYLQLLWGSSDINTEDLTNEIDGAVSNCSQTAQAGGSTDNSNLPDGRVEDGAVVARTSHYQLRKSPWKLFCDHKQGCGTRRRHWHIIYISRSKQWGYNSELGRIIRTGQHKCESITCVACLVQYLSTDGGRTIIKNVLSRDNYDGCKCSFHSVEGVHERRAPSGSDYPNSQGRGGALGEQGNAPTVGLEGMGQGTSNADAMLHAEGGRRVECEQAHSSFGEEPPPGTRRFGIDTCRNPGTDYISNGKLVLLFVDKRCFTAGDGERVLTQTPEGIEFMFARNAGERIKTATNIAKILVFQETLKKRMERAKKFQLLADPEIQNEQLIDEHLARLKMLLEDNNIDVMEFAIVTFKHITNQLGKKNNLYFHGPPSTGKTMIMESLCDVNFNVSRLTGLTPNSQFNFSSVYNTNACFMDECKLTDNQFEQWKLLAGGSKMDTDIKYKDRLMIVDCRLYTASNHQLGLYVQTEGANKAIKERTTQFDFFKPVKDYFFCSVFVWEKLWKTYNMVV